MACGFSPLSNICHPFGQAFYLFVAAAEGKAAAWINGKCAGEKSVSDLYRVKLTAMRTVHLDGFMPRACELFVTGVQTGIDRHVGLGTPKRQVVQDCSPRAFNRRAECGA